MLRWRTLGSTPISHANASTAAARSRRADLPDHVRALASAAEDVEHRGDQENDESGEEDSGSHTGGSQPEQPR
jgi:hypothetical protein